MPTGMLALFIAATCPPGWGPSDAPLVYVFPPDTVRPQPPLPVPLDDRRGARWCVKLAPGER